MKGLAYSLSRWHGFGGGVTVGGDVGAANRAAECWGVGGIVPVVLGKKAHSIFYEIAL